MTRKEKADALKKAATGWAVRYGNAVCHELGIAYNGKLRADVFCLTFKAEITIIEVKSCKADFITDSKFEQYRKYCNKMYFMFHDSDEHWLEDYYPRFKELNIGVLLLDSKTGWAYARVRCVRQKMMKKIKKNLIIRMAWRTADATKFRNRRSRVFIK